MREISGRGAAKAFGATVTGADKGATTTGGGVGTGAVFTPSRGGYGRPRL